jgi:hypothetical protein
VRGFCPICGGYRTEYRGAILLSNEETAVLDSVIDGGTEDQGGIGDLHHLGFACDYELMAASDLAMQESDELEDLRRKRVPRGTRTFA